MRVYTVYIYIYCPTKCCSNILFLKKTYVLCFIDIPGSKHTSQTSKDEQPKHPKINIDTMECLKPEEVEDRGVQFFFDF